MNQPIPRLLAAEEPPPVERVNAERAGRAVLICDHASARVPRALGRLGLAEDEFQRHIAWDIGAAATARHLAGILGAPLVLSGYSRLVIDLNRRLDDPTSMPEWSDGTAVPGNRALTGDDRARRVSALFEPYHQAVAAQLAQALARGHLPALISIHSFTPVFKEFARPWQIGVLWDNDGRIALPLMESLAREGVVVGDNEPYSERDHHGYTMRHHAASAGLAHVLIEVRQDLIDTDRGAEHWARVLAGALSPILADPNVAR